MSTLKANTIQGTGTGGSNVKMDNTSTYVSDGGNVSQNTVQGLTKCWARVSAGTSLVHGFNVSSLTDISTSDSRISYTNTFSDGQHIAAAATIFVVSGSTFVAQVEEYLTDSVRIDTKGDADDESSRSYAVQIVGDLA